jgi:GT2 family glycosyltransferase
MAPASVLRLGTNTGPAGGHAAGLRAFLDSPATFAWIMDDDCVAEPQCLEELLGAVTRNPPSSIFLPLWIDAVTRDAVYQPAWCGVLLPRRVVEGVGLPREDFVWWAEDTEYLTARMAANGVEVRRCELAVVEHQRLRGLQPRPPWKTYYEVRNTVYFRSRVQNGNVRVRIWRATKVLAKLLAKAVTSTSHDRRTQLIAYTRGLGDGVLGRLGLRYPLP